MPSGKAIIVATAPFPYKNMDPTSISLLLAVIIGYSLITIAFDRFLHNRERPNFTLGVTISTLSVCGLVVLLLTHPNDHSKAISLMIVAFFIVLMVGNLLIDKNNIDDQKSGRMSKWGTWWDSWENNYFSNVIDKWETWAVIVILGFVMFGIATRSDSDESFQASSKLSPSTTIATPSVSIKTAHHKATRVHHAAHRTHGVPAQAHPTAPKVHDTTKH